MRNFVRICIVVLTFVLISCGNTIQSNEIENSVLLDTLKTVNFTKLILRFDEGGKQNLHKLHIQTTDRYGCSGYKIATEYSILENTINVWILGIVKPNGGCLTVMSSAKSELGLECLPGKYKLNVLLKDTVNACDLFISTNTVEVDGNGTNLTSFGNQE